ncbi:hypothetical protein TRFO_10066 [Tritrichomonas foetus]|uniref:Uncharacterized protein n=1 Tax=Tritrichomonas foetus TaxID=1144522 RepID=A0A1J4JG37_9EUKA|nr:hypothetical protein TRFO_10066 [Tritrichomonas foetus]|eukprot:OHS96164.1 hypothetical protein TRFO_10066 [Tritrichomonas foetus]
MAKNSIDDSYLEHSMDYGMDGQYEGNSFGSFNHERIEAIPKKNNFINFNNFNSNNNFNVNEGPSMGNFGMFGNNQESSMNNFNSTIGQSNAQQSGGRLLNRKMIKPTLLNKDEQSENMNSSVMNKSSSIKVDLNVKGTNVFAALGAPPIQKPNVTKTEIPQNNINFMSVQQQQNKPIFAQQQPVVAQQPIIAQQQQPIFAQQQQAQKMSIPVKVGPKNQMMNEYSEAPSPSPQQPNIMMGNYQQQYDDYSPPPQPQQYPNLKQQQPKQTQPSKPAYSAPPQPTLSDLFNQRQASIENGFATSLERSMNNFKRAFSNEFQTIMRQVQSPTQLLDIGEFSENLKAEVSNLINTPINGLDIDSTNVTRKVTAAIDEYTKPVSVLLSEASSRNALAADHHLSELRQLQEELDSLHNVLRGSTDNIVKELQRESQNTASIRDAEQLKFRDLEQKMRTLKMKHVELESRANRQNSDREAFERTSKQFEAKRREWEEETLPTLYDEGGVLRQKIMQQLSNLKNEIEHESFEELIEFVNEGLKTVKEESDNMRSELMQLELANRTVMAKAKESHMMRLPIPSQSQMRPTINPALNQTANPILNQTTQQMSQSFAPQQQAPKSARRQMSVVNEAQEKLQLIRRKREEAMRDISGQFL